jgi:hypothetical protein
MANRGIYTLANDAVFDQVVALLNSIEANIGADIPVCVIPYNQQIQALQQEIATRSQVTLFEDWQAIQRWERFAEQVWAAYPKAKRQRLAPPGWYQCHLERKFAAFDGPFEQFAFFDADSLAMQPLDQVWRRLDDYDFVFDDWEHTKTGDSAALDVARIVQSGAYDAQTVQSKLHCSSFFASKRGIFAADELAVLQHRLVDQQQVAWINQWWDDAFLFNYLTLRCDRALFNYTLSPNPQERTGNCAGVDAFVERDWVLYNQEGLKPVHRIHYMSYRSRDFQQLCQGEAVTIPHHDVFLHYRYLHQPDYKPLRLNTPSWFAKTQRLIDHSLDRLSRRTSYILDQYVNP